MTVPITLVSFAMTLVASASLAQAPAVPEPGALVLTAEEKALMDARSRAIRRQANAESERIRGATGGVSVGVRCAEGYVERQRIVPSVSDVEIVATTRTDCEGSKCRGLQVTARRLEGPFDLEVDITCSGG